MSYIIFYLGINCSLPLLQEGTLGTNRPNTHSIETDVVFMNSGSHWKVTNDPLAIVRPALYPSKYCPCVIAGNSHGAEIIRLMMI
jgi:hypothetical protein